MHSTCISRRLVFKRLVDGIPRGFTLIELLIGLALAVSLAVALAPLWVSLETAGATEADRTVQSLQGRVAVARFERDLRLASAAGCPFALVSPILEASTSQVVFLERTANEGGPILVEWEITNGALMRRWGLCPLSRPTAYRHALYRDNKTMLEGVAGGSAFSYVVDGEIVAAPLTEKDLGSIEAVIFDTQVVAADQRSTRVRVSTTARVAR